MILHGEQLDSPIVLSDQLCFVGWLFCAPAVVCEAEGERRVGGDDEDMYDVGVGS